MCPQWSVLMLYFLPNWNSVFCKFIKLKLIHTIWFRVSFSRNKNFVKQILKQRDCDETNSMKQTHSLGWRGYNSRPAAGVDNSPPSAGGAIWGLRCGAEESCLLCWKQQSGIHGNTRGSPVTLHPRLGLFFFFLTNHKLSTLQLHISEIILCLSFAGWPIHLA